MPSSGTLHCMLSRLHIKIVPLNYLLPLDKSLWNCLVISCHFDSISFIGKVNRSECPQCNIFTHLGILLCTLRLKFNALGSF